MIPMVLSRENMLLSPVVKSTTDSAAKLGQMLPLRSNSKDMKINKVADVDISNKSIKYNQNLELGKIMSTVFPQQENNQEILIIDRQKQNMPYKSNDKSKEMWYNKTSVHKQQANPLDISADASDNQVELPDKLFPEPEEKDPKKIEKKRFEEFKRTIDYSNLPTDEEIDFAEGLFENLPGFKERNKWLRNVVKLTRMAEETQKNAEPEEHNRIVLYSNTEGSAQLSENEKKAADVLDKYLTDEERENARNGEGYATYLADLDPEVQDEVQNALRAALLEQDPQVIADMQFLNRAIFFGIDIEKCNNILNILKSKGEINAQDLVDVGLYEQNEIGKRHVKSFVKLLNKEYELHGMGLSLDELNLEYNRNLAAQAGCILMDNIGRISDAAVNGPSGRYNFSAGKLDQIEEASPTKGEKVYTYPDIEEDYTKFKSIEQVKAEKKVEQVKTNSTNGKIAEGIIGRALSKLKGSFGSQLTLQTKSGIRVRLDFAYRDSNGRYVFIEVKSSKTASFTANQRAGYREIAESGAYVRGKKGKSFFGVDEIGPTDTYVVIPNQKWNKHEYYKFN